MCSGSIRVYHVNSQLPLELAKGPAVGPKDNTLKIVLFGSFYPRPDRLGPTTTGLAFLLTQIDSVSRVTVIAPVGSSVPLESWRNQVDVHAIWEYDDLLSLIRAFGSAVRQSRHSDLVIFNIILTNFGKSRLANAIGLTLPFLLKFATKRRVVVYLHNTVESENLELLGYSVSWASRALAKILERALSNFTEVVVPLDRQARKLQQTWGHKPRHVFVPYLEGIVPLKLNPEPAVDNDSDRSEFLLRVLIFGAMGPQKDVAGALRDLESLPDVRLEVETTLAGHVNSNFPGFRSNVLKALSTCRRQRVDWIERVTEKEVAALFNKNDVVFLPYTTVGGYSAVLNVADLFGVPCVAYDIPELREMVRETGSEIGFASPGDSLTLQEKLLHARDLRRRSADRDFLAKLELARQSVAKLLAPF